MYLSSIFSVATQTQTLIKKEDTRDTCGHKSAVLF